MKKRYVVCSLALFLCLLAFSTLFFEPVGAVIPVVVIILAALLAGGVIGGLVGYYVGQNTATQNALESVGWQYVNDTAISYGNLVASVATEYDNQANLAMGLTNYFSRKAEAISQYYVNESSYPVDRVLYYSGIGQEYDNLTDTALESMLNVAHVAENHARTTFTGDFSAYTVYALTQEQYNATSGYYQLVAGQYYDLKTQNMTIKYREDIPVDPNIYYYGTGYIYSPWGVYSPNATTFYSDYFMCPP
jgi:hypothetical protein